MLGDYIEDMLLQLARYGLGKYIDPFLSFLGM